MGKKKNPQPPPSSSDDLLQTLGDFTSKENWENFFALRGSDDSFEWYGEWPELQESLLPLLNQASSSTSLSSLQILVPGCGNSRLSEHLYDAGFHSITNIDFSKVAITNMLHRNVRERPLMRWRIMDMTQMQFSDGSYDIVLDKGGLDALMEPEFGSRLGDSYLSEVKRVLKDGGKFVCLTLAESHVLGLLFSKLRFGWNLNVHAIPLTSSSNIKLQTFMVVAEKENSAVLNFITACFDHSSLDCSGDQAFGLQEALKNENKLRTEYLDGYGRLYTLEDLRIEAKGGFKKLNPGQRFQMNLGEPGEHAYKYKAALLDAKEDSGPFSYHCAVFIVPKNRAHEWLFSSEEGQWQLVESIKTARLIMVALDTTFENTTMKDLQKDLDPLVQQLAPLGNHGAQIPYMKVTDGIKWRNVVKEIGNSLKLCISMEALFKLFLTMDNLCIMGVITSSLSGSVVVEDVIYEANNHADWSFPDPTYRRLIFRRAESLVQSEALLINNDSSDKIAPAAKHRKDYSSSKSKRKGTKKKTNEPANRMEVHHGFLASTYHTGIISGFTLISSYLEGIAIAGNRQAKAVVIGLGAGLLPMFLCHYVPFVATEVVELDPVMLNLAREYFGFKEDRNVKVHIADGIQFVRDCKRLTAARHQVPTEESDVGQCNSVQLHSNGSALRCAESTGTKIDILVIDVDSSDQSSGMTCPDSAFVEESFLMDVRDALSEQGLFAVNLVSRSSSIRDMVVSRMRKVFSHLFCLQVEEDVNMVIFGLNWESHTRENCIPQATSDLVKLMKLEEDSEVSKIVQETSEKIKYLNDC